MLKKGYFGSVLSGKVGLRKLNCQLQDSTVLVEDLIIKNNNLQH
ncbi:MAG: hypothetical protein RLZZ628_1229 [Bacteroidota bacterium]|jgi:hypothetical protein